MTKISGKRSNSSKHMDGPPCSNASSASVTAYAVTFFILYIRFMFMPITAYSIFLQVVIIIILLVLPSDHEYFTQKFVASRIAVLLILAFFAELDNPD